MRVGDGASILSEDTILNQSCPVMVVGLVARVGSGCRSWWRKGLVPWVHLDCCVRLFISYAAGPQSDDRRDPEGYHWH
ncbi:hypothetical protein EYF80_057805 [Liparis tanakae]|uniref:Uncharacterized protein n=1 Tax=Liparis tanakae TaxID=230148 RepID=A0A4Z2ETB5_9TELE|nr:hypothetical protein EYF80_057805 [Liparis tanakae]